ncbi:MAG: hypothetical protein PHW79_08015 [Candidatus Marinimicrobia bacterium]|nr:hypothetical protein [Candidatus Neomarinimicrobiota bacterium]
MDEDAAAEFQAIFDRMDEHERQYKHFESVRNEFVWDALKSIADTVIAYLFQKVERPELFFDIKMKPEALRNGIVIDNDVKFEVDELFETLYDYIADFRDCDAPPGKQLLYRKVEYQLYSEERVQERLAEMEKMSQKPFTPEQYQDFREYCRDETIMRDYQDRYEKTLHDELKRLTVKYYPEIGEITPTGIREIDYILYLTMFRITQEIYKIIDGDKPAGTTDNEISVNDPGEYWNE